MAHRIVQDVTPIRVLQHVFFWMVIAVVLAISLRGSYGQVPLVGATYALRLVVHLLVLAAAVYVNLWVLVPRYWHTKQMARYTLALIATIVGAAVLTSLMYRFVLGHLPSLAFLSAIRPVSLFVFTIQAAVVVGAATMLHLMKEGLLMKDELIKMQDLEKKKMEAELLVLRAQLNPHFLFNSLNNIYALSLEKSDKAPGLIVKLSDLMRYILYECRGPLVPMQKELAFIRDYIALEGVRLDDDVDVRVDVGEGVEALKLPPLLFIPFIENAFKHGVNTGAVRDYIHMRWVLDAPDHLTFSIENAAPPEEGPDDDPYRGVGMANIRQRLSLLYPDRHALHVTRTDAAHTVTLSLDLTPTHDA